MTTIRRLIPLLILASALALAGCASAGTTSAGGPPPPPAGSPSAAGQPSPAAGSPSASAAPICTTHSCIVSDVQQSLVGLVAKDESVITKAVCYKSTVKHNAGNTWTVSCDVTYSDQTVYSGYATLLIAKDQIAWEPTGQVQ